MTQRLFTPTRVWMLAAAVAVPACTMKEATPPPVSGPSEYGTSIQIAITPDILEQDGASQSVVAVTTRGPNGALLANVPLRAEIFVDGVRADFGALSTRSFATGPDGRASLVYRAPMSVPGVGGSTVVDIGVTPVGSDYGNATTRFASLRLVPPGVVLPPSGLQPAFTFTPVAPIANQTVLFDASTSTAPLNNPIAVYAWDFGNGRTGSGPSPSTQYDTPGTYAVRLTISDGYGRSASTAQSITVTPGANPTAAFVFSPTQPRVGQQVNFNAAASAPAPGRSISSYAWDLGDGSPGRNGQSVAHTYGAIGTFMVTLTVTDDAGRRGIVSREVVVAP